MNARKTFIETPLGPEALTLRCMRGQEALSRPFELQLELLALKPIALKSLLGAPLTVHLQLPEKGARYFHGHATQVSGPSGHGRHLAYHVTLRPWLWLLTRASDCRIFQNKTVPQIVKQVFQGHGFSDFEDRLGETYRPREYLVQYRETDFAFVSRLLEQEGIYYYFKHDKTKHTLVLGDGPSSHAEVPGYGTIPYYPPSPEALRQRDHVDSWQPDQAVQTGGYVLDDYDFKRPKAALQVRLKQPLAQSLRSFEMYDYPGEYEQTREGEGYARLRLEEQQARFEVFAGAGNARGLTPGALFRLQNHPRAEQNVQYLITSARYTLDIDDYESSAGGGASALFRCELDAIKHATPFRPARVTPRPLVAGHQTAHVVGRRGEEIWTDEFGRVKVQFPWDRLGKSDENSSCWVRVAQVWAGSGFGSVHIPRVGQEVLVSFLEGDPDRPIVTGRVYNGNAKPPFPLPSKAMISGTRSESTPGGGGYNEISLDDSKGKEAIVVHAQRDMRTTVERDASGSIERNLTIEAGGDVTITGKKTALIDVADELTIRVGRASITLRKSGDVSIQGAKISLKALGDLVLRGLKLSLN